MDRPGESFSADRLSGRPLSQAQQYRNYQRFNKTQVGQNIKVKESDCYEIGDSLHGSKIYAEARKVDGPRIIVKTGRHRAQGITLIENANAVIIRKLKYVYEKDEL